MQVRIGKKRYYQINRQLSGVALASFRNALIALTFSGCALFTTQQKSLKDLSKVCLSAEGRGRLEHSKGRHLFEFESLLEKKERKWSLGLDLPVIGQELLYFTYPGPNEVKTSVSGTFATRLKMDITSKKKKGELRKFFLMTGELLSIIDTQRIRAGWNFDEVSGRLVLEKSLAGGEQFKFEAFNAQGHFERLSLSLMKKGKFGKLKKVMKMNLFLSQCFTVEKALN